MDEPTNSAMLDLGSGVKAWWMIADGVKYGIHYRHPADTDTGWCESGIFFDIPANQFLPRDRVWQVESYDPLTVSPSLRCNACGHHGHVRNGRWEPA